MIHIHYDAQATEGAGGGGREENIAAVALRFGVAANNTHNAVNILKAMQAYADQEAARRVYELSDAAAFAEWIVENRWQPTSSNQWEQVDKKGDICSEEHTTSEVYKLFLQSNQQP